MPRTRRSPQSRNPTRRAIPTAASRPGSGGCNTCLIAVSYTHLLLYAFGSTLPYLAKIIAPAQTLSLQVHPTKEIAREGYLREEVLGIERTDTRRVYRDMNHKPEMIYALTEFSALVGFRVPRKARQLLVGLEGELADRLRHRLKLSTVRGGLRSLARCV